MVVASGDRAYESRPIRSPQPRFEPRDERRVRARQSDQKLVRQRQPRQPGLRAHTRTHRCQPSELSHCSADFCKRSRFARRRSSRSSSDRRRRGFVAIVGPFAGARPLRACAVATAPERVRKSDGRYARADDQGLPMASDR
jgi:hypothetical protein